MTPATWKDCILIDHGTLRYDGSLSGLKGELAPIRRVNLLLGSSGLPDPDSSTLKRLGQDTRSFNGQQERSDVNKSELGLRRSYEFSTLSISIPDAMGILFNHFSADLLDVQLETVSLEDVLAKRFLSSSSTIGQDSRA
jgi:hypothetical protein